MSPDRHRTACPAADDLHALVAGDLDADRDASLRAHLAGCPDCQILHDQAVALDQKLRSLPAFECPPALAARLRTIPQPKRRVPGLQVLIPLAMAAGLLGVLLHRVLMTPPSPGPQQAAAPSDPDAAELARAERQVALALALFKAAGRETAVRAGEKIVAIGLVEPARRLQAALLPMSRRAPRDGPASEQPGPPGPPL